MRLGGVPARTLVTQGTSSAGDAQTTTVAADANQSWSIVKVLVTYIGGAGGAATIAIAGTLNSASVTINIERVIVDDHTVEIDFRENSLVFDEGSAVTVTADAIASATCNVVVLHR